MKFDAPAGTNPIDRLAVVGRPTERVDGVLKVCGLAPYAYERHDVVDDCCYGYIVGTSVARGRVAAIDVDHARAAAGVVAVITCQDTGTLPRGTFYASKLLADPDVQHYHQAVAVVVAESFEQARAAATQVHVEYEVVDGRYDLAAEVDRAVESKVAPPKRVGDFDTAYANAPVNLEAVYTTPDHAHVMMEPHATIARWNERGLSLWTSAQALSWSTRDLQAIFDLAPNEVHVSSPYIGGGFGGKATVLADAALAAVAARHTGRPVKITLQRALIFNNTTHRAATRQRIRIGASAEGEILAIGHEAWSGNLDGGPPELATLCTPLLYAGANRMTATYLAHLDLAEANAMRAPGETPGMMALEIAMDELAERLGMDPVALRIRNDTQVDPANPERRFSTRRFVDCFEQGATRFGWNARSPEPGTRRDGSWLIGLGTAAAIRAAPIGTSGARVRLTREKRVIVETDMTDIGTGSYTILAQTAAEMLGVPLADVEVRLGESSYPQAYGSVGQRGGNSSASGVYAACIKLRGAVLTALGITDADPAGPSTVFADGCVYHAEQTFDLAAAVAGGEQVGEDKLEYGDIADDFVHQSLGAHFVEVAVHAHTGEIRVRRMLAVCAAGRILNPMAARSQIIGGMTMGVGAALMEAQDVDTRYGFFVNHDMASYEVPVHADIPDQTVVFLDDVDETMSPMKAKGVGELGISGAPAAVANGIYNATGIRIRDYPITPDKLIDKLPRPEHEPTENIV